jgi:hypothetical protein
MNVYVDQPGARDQSVRVDHFCPLPGGGGKGTDQFPIGDEKVAHFVAFGRGIDDAGALNPEGGHW